MVNTKEEIFSNTQEKKAGLSRQWGVMMRKIYGKCFREYFEEDGPAAPMEELGRIFLGSVQDIGAVNVCKECRKDISILNFWNWASNKAKELEKIIS